MKEFEMYVIKCKLSLQKQYCTKSRVRIYNKGVVSSNPTRFTGKLCWLGSQNGKKSKKYDILRNIGDPVSGFYSV